MGRDLTILYDQLASPSSAVYALAQRRPYWIAAFVVLLVVVSKVTAVALMGPPLIAQAGTAFFLLFIIQQLLLAFVLLVLTAGIYHLAATNDEMIGDARVAFLLVCLCWLPYIFLGPLALVARGLGMAWSAWLLGLLVLHTWVFVLKVIAVKNYYSISTGRSVLVVVLPLILLAFLVLGAILLGLGFIGSVLPSLVT